MSFEYFRRCHFQTLPLSSLVSNVCFTKCDQIETLSSHQSASMVILQRHCKIQQRLFVAPSALFYYFLLWKNNSLNQHFQRHLIFPGAIHIPGSNPCPDRSACRNFSSIWSARWKKTPRTVLKTQNIQTLFTIFVAPMMYVVRKFISQHLLYGDFTEKHAPHLMYSSPLEDNVLLSLFYFFTCL